MNARPTPPPARRASGLPSPAPVAGEDGPQQFLEAPGQPRHPAATGAGELTSTPITIKDIRAGEGGLRSHEMSLLRLLDKVSDEHVIDVNDKGKKVGYKPGVVVGGKDLEHDCGVHHGIGYFIELLLLLGLFARSPLSVRLKGITNDTKDPSVDTFQMVTLHMLKHFGVPLEGM
uniref:RNA 3'-terminal phosphate cyclase domain-containing protein n=1 Tax=Triticum urartu TaxID=4572 RepID=A0A8R7Q8H8_TRIUA